MNMTTTLTLIWIVFPFLVGFTIYLLPRLDRSLALVGTVVSAAYAFSLFGQSAPLTLRLLDHFGVSLLLDPLAGFFILTNAVVTTAVIFYCWRSDKPHSFMLRF